MPYVCCDFSVQSGLTLRRQCHCGKHIRYLPARPTVVKLWLQLHSTARSTCRRIAYRRRTFTATWLSKIVARWLGKQFVTEPSLSTSTFLLSSSPPTSRRGRQLGITGKARPISRAVTFDFNVLIIRCFTSHSLGVASLRQRAVSDHFTS